MLIAVSLFSNEVIKPRDVDVLMKRLQGQRDKNGWVLVRNEQRIFIEMADIDPQLYTDDDLLAIGRLLGAAPRSRILLMLSPNSPDQFQMRMARAVAKAMAEMWPIVFDDNTDRPELVEPPSVAGSGS